MFALDDWYTVFLISAYHGNFKHILFDLELVLTGSLLKLQFTIVWGYNGEQTLATSDLFKISCSVQI